jgi:glycosyltransferase involved in cell wall biosynthesis
MRITVLGVRGMATVQGGVETHAEQLYERLVRLGCDVEVLVRAPFVPRHLRTYRGMRLRRLWSPTQPGIEAIVHSIIGVLYAGIRRPDILHVHAIGPAIVVPIARLLGLNVVVTHHGLDYEREKWGRFARWILRMGERSGMRRAHARIVISQTIANLLRSRYGLDSHLIPNGVAVAERCSATEHLQRFGLEPGKYFLHVGRMVPEKRQLDLIQAYARRQRRWKLAMVGALDASDYSQQIAAAAGTAGLVLPGYLRGDPLKQLYSHAGAFVLPSSHEGLPIAMLEALAYGLPVLASDIPANVEIGLDSANYYPVGDLAALSAALTRLEDTPPDYATREARRAWTAAKYDWNRISEQTLDVYRQVRRHPRASSAAAPR